MFGLKICVRIQTFRRGPPVPLCNFCHPATCPLNFFAKGDSDLDKGDSSLHYHYTHSSFSNLPPFVPFAAPYIGHHETHK